jgi:hypothetical protein
MSNLITEERYLKLVELAVQRVFGCWRSDLGRHQVLEYVAGAVQPASSGYGREPGVHDQGSRADSGA